LSVAQGPCSAVLPTVHGCHYAFQKFPFFCVTLYMWFGEPHPPTESSPTRLSTSGQTRYKGWPCTKSRQI